MAESAKPEEKNKGIVDSEKVFTNIEQYILSQHLSEIKDNYSDLAKNHGEFKYYTYRQVDGPGHTLINKLRGIDDIGAFYQIKTSVLSLLQPKFKLYKVVNEQFKYRPDGTPDQSSVAQLPTPCYREIKFSDNFGIETAASVQDYLNYETNKPSFRNVGIDSFMITQNGESHGAIENNIECKITLTFKSLKDLRASPPGEPHVRYVDLILFPPARISEDTETYNPKHYEIKVLYGYTAPTAEQLSNLNLDAREIKALRDIEKLNQVVALGLYDYNIDIQESGIVKVTASYRGRVETVVGSNQVNIFQDSLRIGASGKFEIDREAKARFNVSHVYETSSRISKFQESLSKAKCQGTGGDCKAKQELADLTEKDVVFSFIVKEAIIQYRSEAERRALSHAGSAADTALSRAGLKRDAGKETLIVEDDEKYFEWFRNEINTRKMMSIAKKKISAFKGLIFTGFVDALIDGNQENRSGTDLVETRIFCGIADPSRIKKALNTKASLRDEEPEEEPAAAPETESAGMTISATELQKKVNSLSTAAASHKLGFSFGRCKPNLADLKEASKAAWEAASSAATVSEESAATTPKSEDAKATKPEPKAVMPTWMSDGNYKFYYVFLGDIVELACKNARLGALEYDDNEEFPLEKYSIFPSRQYVKQQVQDTATGYPLVNARILLGPIDYIDASGDVKQMNLAKLPISFAYFRSWFIETITKTVRTQMNLGDFLSSLINNLAIPSLHRGMPKSSKPPHVTTHTLALTLPGKISDTGIKHQICGGEVSATQELLPVTRIIDTKSALFQKNYLKNARKPRSSESLLRTSYDYLLFYATSNNDIIDRAGNPAEDVREGIYHFNIGSDRGLLRKMEFSRENLPDMAELASEMAAARGDRDHLQQLKFPYNTDIFLVGTSLFTPGMFYYINPSLTGLGSVENAASLAYQMKLGGYHLVETVSTNISAGKYVTKITGRQQR